MPSCPPSQILPLMLAFNFWLVALSLEHFQCLEKPSWSFKHKHRSPLLSSSHRSYGFPVQGVFPVLLTLWFTPQLLLVVWHLSKKDHTSKQRCVTGEDCGGPCKPLPDGNGCPEHFISKMRQAAKFGFSHPCCYRCGVTALRLPQHYTHNKWQQKVIQQEGFAIGMGKQIIFCCSYLLIRSRVVLYNLHLQSGFV